MLAPLLAGRPRVRESRSGGHTYLRRWERPLTARLPAVPAAVPIYSAAGDTRVLVVDLDASRGGAAAVRRDAAAVPSWSGRPAAGSSPMRALAAAGTCTSRSPCRSGSTRPATSPWPSPSRTPTMDPSPNQNLTDGLIRPPGSVHPSGGHQVLHGTLTAAYELASTGNPPAVLDRPPRRCWPPNWPPSPTRDQQPSRPTPPTTARADLPRRSGARELAADYLRIATTGLYDTARYRSPSEARQAVLDAAVWAGLTLPGRAGPHRERHLARSGGLLHPVPAPRNPPQGAARRLAKALAYVTAQQAKKPTQSLVRKSPTSEPPSHGGAPPITDQDQQRTRGTPAEYQWIRTWWTALGLLEHTRYTDRAGIGKRWVLRAMGEAAMKTGSRYIAFGTRSLSVATGLDHTTVAAHLRALREEDDPLIDLIENDRGLQGDLYQLRIPDEIAARAGRGQLEGRETARAAAGVPGTRPPRRVRLRSPRTHQKAGRNAASTVTRHRAVPHRGVRGAGNPRRVEPRRTHATAGGSSSPAPACSCWPSNSAAPTPSAPW